MGKKNTNKDKNGNKAKGKGKGNKINNDTGKGQEKAGMGNGKGNRREVFGGDNEDPHRYRKCATCVQKFGHPRYHNGKCYHENNKAQLKSRETRDKSRTSRLDNTNDAVPQGTRAPAVSDSIPLFARQLAMFLLEIRQNKAQVACTDQLSTSLIEGEKFSNSPAKRQVKTLAMASWRH